MAARLHRKTSLRKIPTICVPIKVTLNFLYKKTDTHLSVALSVYVRIFENFLVVIAWRESWRGENMVDELRVNASRWNAKIWRLQMQQKRLLIMESLKDPKPCELVNDYTSQSSVHGLRYVSNVKANIVEK